MHEKVLQAKQQANHLCAWQVHESQLWKKMPIQTFHPLDAESLELLIFLGRHDYFSSCTRVAPICFGALAALCVLDSSWVQKMAR